VRGGDLGVVTRGQTVGPFDSAMFAAPIGKVVGPVKTGYGFHIMEVHKRWGKDSAQVSHILIPIVRTDSSEMNLLNEADSLETLGSEMSLDKAASNLGLSVESATVTSTFPFLAGAGRIAEGSDWVFNTASPGDVSQVFENAQAFYCLQVESSSPAGVLPLDQAKSTILSRLRFQKKMALAEVEGQKVLDKVKAGEPLVKVASDLGLEVRHAGPFSRDDFVPGIGRENKAIGAAFGLKPNQVSGLVNTGSNLFIIEDIKRIPADSTAWADQKVQQRQAWVSNEQQQRLQEWIKALRSAATIVDNRAKVLQQSDTTKTTAPTGTNSSPF
jgi:peptidylprolyl isomerase/peptidyl-prolyl cis-trans isomerase D